MAYLNEAARVNFRVAGLRPELAADQVVTSGLEVRVVRRDYAASLSGHAAVSSKTAA
jgi:hypothetical protein